MGICRDYFFMCLTMVEAKNVKKICKEGMNLLSL